MSINAPLDSALRCAPRESEIRLCLLRIYDLVGSSTRQISDTILDVFSVPVAASFWIRLCPCQEALPDACAFVS